MKPGLTKDEELLVEQVERLGTRRLAEIVVNHCHRDERLYQTVRIALAASTPGGPLAETLATEIDAVRTSRQFYGYRESTVLAQELDRPCHGNDGRPDRAELIRSHAAATASCQCRAASARKIRSVAREMRWR